MVGFGILMAGAAQGAANASNMNVQAQNQLELDQQREALREEFLNKRFDKELAVSRENAKAAGLMRSQEYDRKREDKILDAEMQHKRTLEVEGIKDKRSAASNATRLQAAAMRKNAASGDPDNSDMYVTLKNGKKYLPQTQLEKEARALVVAGRAPDYETAIDVVTQRGLMSAAARDPLNFSSEDIVNTSGRMVNQLYGSQKLERLKLEDLIK